MIRFGLCAPGILIVATAGWGVLFLLHPCIDGGLSAAENAVLHIGKLPPLLFGLFGILIDGGLSGLFGILIDNRGGITPPIVSPAPLHRRRTQRS